MTSPTGPQFTTGQTVQHRAQAGTEETAHVSRVTTRGVWVVMADGSRQQWHPDEIINSASER